MFLFPGGQMQVPGTGCRSEHRRASRAGAQHSIWDAGALRAPAPTKDLSDCCNDFLGRDFRGLIFLSSVFLSRVGGVRPASRSRKGSQQRSRDTQFFI